MGLRENNIRELDRRTFDVLIVGGGINGAVAASALTSQGASVALVERGDFAGYTSQASSNLVWGGVKYLESLEFALVRKLCTSRNKLIDAYPSIVQEIRFLATLGRGGRRGRFPIWLGTWLYWLFGNGFTRIPRLLSNRDIAAREPAVDVSGAVGGVEYSDAFMVDNDARFVFHFVRAAIDHGGIVANYVESTGAEREGDAWVTTAVDRISGRTITIRSRTLVNAGGPFVEEHNGRTGLKTRCRHVFSKGVHLLVDRITDDRRVLAFFADDGRPFFVIPMGAKSCIGTTDTRVEALPPLVTEEDRHFILDNINRRLRLPSPLTPADIISERCGVRPLVVDGGGGDRDDGEWTSLSRKHVVEVDADRRHVSIFGGKLTDCLNVGDEIAAAVASLGVELPYAGIRWYGESPAIVREEFEHQARLMGLDDLTAPESSEPLTSRLWRRYGRRALLLLEDIRHDPSMAEVLIKGTEYIRCEVTQAARHEMIVKLEDFLRRRSKIAMVERTETIRAAPGLMEACRILFGEDAQARFDEYFEDHREG